MVTQSKEPDEKDAAPSGDIYGTHIGGSLAALDKLLRTTDLDVGCSHPHFSNREDGTVSLFAFATFHQAEQLRAQGYAVEQGENVSRRADSLKGEIGAGDRFEGGRISPHGFGLKRTGGPIG